MIKILQFFQNLNKNIKDIISWCKIEFKSFIFLIFIICLLYNIVFISYMEENIDCFAECSLKEEDESILLKDIKELKNLKIEELNFEEDDLNIEENPKKNIIMYLIEIFEKIKFVLMFHVFLHFIYFIFRDFFILFITDQMREEIYNYFNQSLFFKELYLSIEFLNVFVLSSLECYLILGCCLLSDLLFELIDRF